jgi:hypothetical protein
MTKTGSGYVPKDFGCCKGQLFDSGYQWHQFTCPNWEVHYYADKARRAQENKR